LILKLFICSAALFSLLRFASSPFAQVETWKIDPAHSAAQFSVLHMGISTVRREALPMQ
jgi:polyisoprenoid-binding protein YceI